MTRLLRNLLATACTAAAALMSPATAPAAETPAPPAHLEAYNLAWLNYIDPQDLPPTRYAVCIVDSGVAITPDTPADDPSGPILRRLSIDGGSGEPQGTAPEQLHGTRMAMAAIAPQNDWGTIGTWSAGRVISVRAMVEGETTLRPPAYGRGIAACFKDAAQPIAAVNLSFTCGSCVFSDQDLALLAERVAKAHDRSASVVGAAGNDASARTGMPAALDGVLAVGAGDARGGACSYATLDERVRLLGPACPVDNANPLTGDPERLAGGGSSSAAVIVSSLLAAIRTLRPDATREEAEAWLVAGTREVDGRWVLDGEAVAHLAGLDDVVARAAARRLTQDGTHAPLPPEVTAPVEPPASLPPVAHGPARPVATARPRARVSWRRGVLRVVTRNAPRGAKLEVAAFRPRGEFRLQSRRLRARMRRGTARMRIWRPSKVQLRFTTRVQGSRVHRRSPATVLRFTAHRYR